MQGAWFAILAAGLFEVMSTTCIKWSDGFRRKRWLAGFIATMGASVYLMSVAVEVIPIGTTYAVWTGIGAVGTSIVGMALFGESRSPLRIAFLLLIIAGVIGLRTSASG